MAALVGASVESAVRTVRDLRRAGVAEEYINGWLNNFGRDLGDVNSDVNLTELQRVVANDPDATALRGNLMIAGPTSAGKTLAAEIQMARMLTRATSPDGCIYAVPLRALATEKFEHFKRLFGEDDVYVSSGDYQDQDSLILNRRFRIAVVVYEKLFGWLLKRNARNAILQKTGLLIVDEIQMLGNVERGARLELLLTFVLRVQRQTERAMAVVGLGPSAQALSQIGDWLRAKTICASDERRPVPLVEACACPDGLLVAEPVDERVQRVFPQGIRIPVDHCPKWEDMLHSLVKKCVSGHEASTTVGTRRRLLVYCPTKDGVEKTAENLAKTIGKRQSISRPLIKRMQAMERTHALKRLAVTVQSGVGFHHGDLTFDERLLVEEMFRRTAGPDCIDVLCCTSTLSMGVNLPADFVVFTSPEIYKARNWDTRLNTRDMMSPLEYRNFAGRAGRLRQNASAEDMGISLFLTDRKKTDAQRAIIDGIVNRCIEPVRSELLNWPFGLEPLVLAAAECASAESRGPAAEGVVDVLSGSFAGHCVEASSVVTRRGFDDRVGKVMETLNGIDIQLVDPDWSVRGAGHVVARAGIHIDTFKVLRSLCERVADQGVLNKPLVILEELAGVPEIARMWPNAMPDGLRQQTEITRGLHDLFSTIQKDGLALGPMALRIAQEVSVPSVAALERLMRVAAMHLWMQGRSAIEISGQPMLRDLRYGACKQLADQFAWLVSAMPDLWDAMGLSQQCTAQEAADCRWSMERLERRLTAGVPDDLVGVAQLRVPGVHRENLMELWSEVSTAFGRNRAWDHPVDLLGLPLDKIGKESRPTLGKLKAVIRLRSWRDDPRPCDIRQQHDASYACERDGNRRVAIDQALCVENLWHCIGARLIEAIAQSLRLKPFNASVREVSAPDEKRFFVLYEGKWTELVHVDCYEAGDAAKQVFELFGRPAPNGKHLDGLVVVADGDVEALKAAVIAYAKPIRVLTREATGYLITRCLLEPESREDLAGVGGDPLPERLVRWLADCSGCAVLASEHDAANGVLADLEHRGRELCYGELLGHVSESEPVVKQVAVVTPTEDNELQELSRGVDAIPGQSDAFCIKLRSSLQGIVGLIREDPSRAVADIRIEVENLTKSALRNFTGIKDSELRRLDGHAQIEKLKGAKVMSTVWGRRLDALHYQTNSAHHTEDVAGPSGHFQVASFRVTDAIEYMRQPNAVVERVS